MGGMSVNNNNGTQDTQNTEGTQGTGGGQGTDSYSMSKEDWDKQSSGGAESLANASGTDQQDGTEEASGDFDRQIKDLIAQITQQAGQSPNAQQLN